MEEINREIEQKTGIDRTISLQFYIFSRIFVGLISIPYFILNPLQAIYFNVIILYSIVFVVFIYTIASPYLFFKVVKSKYKYKYDILFLINSALDWFILAILFFLTDINPRLVIHIGFINFFYYTFYRPFLNPKVEKISKLRKDLENYGYIQIIPILIFLFMGFDKLAYNTTDFLIIFLTLMIGGYFLNRIQIGWTINELYKEKLRNEADNLNQEYIKSKSRIEFLANSLNTLGDLSSTKNNIEVVKKQIIQHVANNFEAEYCSIGRIDLPYLFDEYIYPTNDFLTDEYKTSFLEDSLIGNVIKNNITFHWSFAENGDLLSFIRENYKFNLNESNYNYYNDSVLESKKHINVFIKALSHNGVNYGYIHVVNFNNKIEIEEIVNSVSSFEVIINNYNNLNNIILDEKQINDCYKQNNINIAINNVLKFIASEFKPDLATFWIPIRDGVFEEQQDKLLLRNYFMAVGQDFSFKEDIVVPLANLDTEQIKDKVTIVNSDRSKLVTDFSYNKKVIIPIPISEHLKDRYKFNHWGFFIFYYKEQGHLPIDSIKSRLEFIAENYRYLFERTVYISQVRRIDHLALAINKISKSSETQFFNSLTQLIKEVLECEEVSIFFVSEKKDGLYLKFSTAARFSNYIFKSIIEKNELELLVKNQTCVYNLTDPDSLTSFAYLGSESFIVNNVKNSKYTNRTFMEITRSDSEHQSLLAIQIRNHSENIGVIRCINKEVSTDNIYHNKFNEGDRNLLEIITSLISPLLVTMSMSKGLEEAIVNFGHETRTPLSSILGDIELLAFHFKQREISSSDIELSFASMRSQIFLISKLMGEFTSSTKNRQRAIIETPLISVYSFMKKLEDIFFNDLVLKGIKLKVFSSDKDLEIGIDLNDLQQIVYNIVRNAINYSHVKSIITVKHSFENNFHIIKIRNFGIGIRESEVDKIFILKYRGEQVENIGIEGSGIGLSISREKAEANGGSVEVTSLNNPTEFTIKLKSVL